MRYTSPGPSRKPGFATTTSASASSRRFSPARFVAAYGKLVSPGRKRLRLVRGPVRSGRGADRRDARDVHEPCARLDPLQDAHGAVHVRLAQERKILRLVGDSAGQVEDELAAGRRRADVVRHELPAENLNAHRLERARVRPRAHQSAERVAALEQQRDEMTSEEPGRPCEENPHRRRLTGACARTRRAG